MVYVCKECKDAGWEESAFEALDKKNDVRVDLKRKHRDVARICCDRGVFEWGLQTKILDEDDGTVLSELRVRNRLLEELVVIMREEMSALGARIETLESKTIDLEGYCEVYSPVITKVEQLEEDMKAAQKDIEEIKKDDSSSSSSNE
jgi:exonuclease VII small subunit